MKGLYGLLSGPAFSISNGIAGLYFGKIADKSNRSRLLGFAAIAWSLTSIATGSVNSFTVMCIMRFGLGVFQGATEPLIFSLIADTIPKKKLPTANSLIKAAPYAGSAISSLLILMIPQIGWRGCFNFMGGIGVLAGILALFTIEEPARGVLNAEESVEENQEQPKEEEDETKSKNPIKMVFGNPIAAACIAASSCRYITMFAFDYYFPAFMLMTYPAYKTQFASLAALCTLSCGLFAAISGGVIAEKIGHKDPRNYSRICWIGAAVAWPCAMLMVLTTNNFWLSIAMLFARYAFGENYWSPNLYMIQKSCKPSEFGSYIGAYQFFNIIAGCISTIGVGFLVNNMGFGQTPKGLGRVIAGVASIGYAGSILAWWKAGNLLKRKSEMTEKLAPA